MATPRLDVALDEVGLAGVAVAVIAKLDAHTGGAAGVVGGVGAVASGQVVMGSVPPSRVSLPAPPKELVLVDAPARTSSPSRPWATTRNGSDGATVRLSTRSPSSTWTKSFGGERESGEHATACAGAPLKQPGPGVISALESLTSTKFELAERVTALVSAAAASNCRWPFWVFTVAAPAAAGKATAATAAAAMQAMRGVS